MNRDQIIQSALAAAHTGTPANDSFIEGLDALIAGLDGCATVSPAGRASIHRQMTGHLANRFAVEAYMFAHPALARAPITAPVFVLGLPRTGTTLMVNLLNQDTAARSLRKWEANYPVPPAAAGRLSTDPRSVAQNEQRRREVAAGKLRTNIHFEWYDEPTECVYLLMQDFKSTAWDAFLPMPSYSEFLMRCDMTSAYRWHQQVLRHLQENNKGRWTLKAPGHAMFAADLLKVYPDARLVWMHRDPHVAVASHASLIAAAHRRFQPEADGAWIARHYPDQLAAHADRMLAVEASHPSQVFHVFYDDVVTEPAATTEQLYADIGLPYTDEIRLAVEQRVAAHPRGKLGAHDYGLDRFGIDHDRVTRLFAAYNDRLAQLRAQRPALRQDRFGANRELLAKPIQRARKKLS